MIWPWIKAVESSAAVVRWGPVTMGTSDCWWALFFGEGDPSEESPARPWVEFVTDDGPIRAYLHQGTSATWSATPEELHEACNIIGKTGSLADVERHFGVRD